MPKRHYTSNPKILLGRVRKHRMQKLIKKAEHTDNDIMWTITENNDPLSQGCDAMIRRAFVGIENHE